MFSILFPLIMFTLIRPGQPWTSHSMGRVFRSIVSLGARTLDADVVVIGGGHAG